AFDSGHGHQRDPDRSRADDLRRRDRLHPPRRPRRPGLSRAAAVLACAGSGVRMGGGNDKLLWQLRDRPGVAGSVAGWSWLAPDSCPLVESITVVASEPNLEDLAAVLDHLPTSLPLELTLGGARRQDPVARAVEHMSAASPELVVVHDGARPLVSSDLLVRVIEAATEHGAATAALPLRNAC